MIKIVDTIFKAIIITIILLGAIYFINLRNETKVLNEIIKRLSADSRIAEVVVTSSRFDPSTKKHLTTIKFLEFDTQNRPLQEKYFTFSSNIIQFQALVIRFDDYYVRTAHPLKGKSAYIFMKAFSLLDNSNAEVFPINKVNEVPSGYEIYPPKNIFEEIIWKKFWRYALNEKEAKSSGIKNAQIEAPGTRFIPGLLYTIKIEHKGGIRIDVKEIADKSDKN